MIHARRLQIPRGVIALCAIVVLLSQLFLLVHFAEAATFTDDTQSEFDAGSYSATAWDTNHVELNLGQTSGTFTSQIFDAGTTTNWSQINWSESLPNQNKFITIDADAGIFKSVNSASTFSSINSDYNSSSGNAGVDDLVVTSAKTLYILHNTAVWRSTDYGVNWTQRTSAYGGATGLFMAVESDDDLFVVDGGEDVWRSTDGGANWTQVVDNFNGGVGNMLGFTAFGTTLYAVDVAADIWTSINNGTTWSVVNSDYNGAVADGGTDYMTANSSSHLFIGRNTEIYRSTDSGANWTQMTSNYGDVDIQALDVDSSDYLYAVNVQEEIYRSINNGTSWTQVSTGDINGSSGDVEGLVVFPVAVDLTFSARSGSVNPPTDSFSGSSTNPAGGNPNVSDARYFQYRASLSTDDNGVTPELSSVTVTYTTPDTTAPSIPTGLSASVISSSQINISWTASTDNIGVTGYKIFRESIQIATTTSLSHQDTTLSPSTSYTYTVAAYDAAGNTSAQSTGASATTSALSSSPPTFSLTPITSFMGPPGPSNADFYGQAYPGSKIDVLRKSNVVGQYESVPLTLTSVSDNGEFQVTIENFLAAEYFFAIRATDKNGGRSRMLPLISQFIPSGNHLILKDIIIPPTIDVIPSVIPPGQPINVLGYAAPSSTVEVTIDEVTQYHATTNAFGFYTFSTSTASLSLDIHTVKARFVLSSGAKSDFSLQRTFKVSPLAFPKTDLNGDSIVNASDLSIFLFRWESSDTTLKKSVDFNDDSKVDISDFSIFLESNK